MATYIELRNLWSNDDLRNKIELAQTVVANEIISLATGQPANHTARVRWAVAVITSPSTWAEIMVRLLIAKNASLETAQITAAPDVALADAVRGVVDSFANNMGA